MKRLLSAALALSMVAGPAAFAQQAEKGGQPQKPPQAHAGGQQKGHAAARPAAPQAHHVAQAHNEQRPAVGHPPQAPGPAQRPASNMTWHRGDHFNVPPGQRQVVSDWHSHRGLYAPPPGQEWVQYNNQYMLVAVTSGIIGAILGAVAASQ
jgi:Ni/Co efflux regulator RcnB